MSKFRVISFFIGLIACSANGYRIGVGISDITGPIGVTLMGYGQVHQRGSGIHTRQWSRAFIVEDDVSRVAFVNVDLGMMGDGVRIQVIKALEEKLGGLYNMDNVILSATHTHSAPGGFLMHTLFDFPSFGFCNETFNALVSGIVKSVELAHGNLQEGRIYTSRGVLHDANINRSPLSYEANPEEEKAQYPHNVDKDFVQVKFVAQDGTPLGVINWFAVHATSMNNTNTLISSDNMGYAAIKFEQRMNPDDLIGKGKFVAAFASSNLGDVSPNLQGPKCHKSGTECDVYSKCKNPFEECYSLGPGDDMYESTRIIGERLFDKAWELWQGSSEEITGPMRAVHQYVDMPKAEAEVLNKKTGKMEKVKGCSPAMGYAAGAGCTDGPFLFFLKQGLQEHIWWLDAVSHILMKPTEEDKNCHAPKPILLATGRGNFPFEWQPHIVSTQVALFGNLTFACVPGEFTTMSGRRMRNAIAEARGTDPRNVIIVGLCNTYSDYITTFEEYQMQRYEAGSTIFGPHTLSLHLSQYKKLTSSLVNNRTLERGPEPQGLNPNKMFSLIAPVVYDNAKPGHFGDVVVQPNPVVAAGDVVRATFRAGHPRNDLKLGKTYLTVERLVGEEWKVVATDANWETKMHWRRTVPILGNSEIDVEWKVPQAAVPGTYRIQHFGAWKKIDGVITPYAGTTKVFQVIPIEIIFS